MLLSFMHSFQSEWLKRKRSAASWLVIAGGLFIPVIMILARIVEHDGLYAANISPYHWEKLFNKCWQFMALFLLPMGAVLATSLVTQLEFRNNTWKQVHASPQGYSRIFFAKLLVILVMLFQFFLLFNLGIYLAGVIPPLFFRGVPFPLEPFPVPAYLEANAQYFVCCLPIVGLQYLLSLQFRNFLVPLGAGIALVVAALIGLSWEYGYTIPYCYCGLQFLSKGQANGAGISLLAWAAAYFFLFTMAGYFLYLRKKEKG